MANQTREQTEADRRILDEVQTRIDFVHGNIMSEQEALDGMLATLEQRRDQRRMGAAVIEGDSPIKSGNDVVTDGVVLNGKEVSHGS